MPVIIIVLLGIVFGMIIADPILQLLTLLVGEKSTMDKTIANYISSLTLSDEQLIYGIFICISFLFLILLARNKLKTSIEKVESEKSER